MDGENEEKPVVETLDIEIPKKVMERFDEYCEKNGVSGKQKEQLVVKLKEIVKKTSFEPGEAVGVITAQSISEPATQMSLDYNEKIIVKHKDMIRACSIGHFTDGMINGLGSLSDSGWDVCDLSDMEIFVPSISQDEKMEWKRVLACSRHKSPERLARIRTLSGREIVATDSHSFVIRKDNKIVPVSGKELKPSERIPVAKLFSGGLLNSINLRELVGEKYERAKKPLPCTLELDETLGWIFGAYLSEGNCVQNFVSISNVDESFLARTKEFASGYGLTFNEYDNFRGFARGHDIHINSTLLSSLLAGTCGKGSRNKKIPDFAYSANDKFVSGLLQAYFDGDGNVSVERGVIRTSSNSKELIDGIAFLMSRFGIFSHKGQGKQFTLSIPSRYAPVFKEKIGFCSENKKTKLDELCRNPGQKQDFVEVVGGFGDLLVRISKKLGYPTRYVNSFTKRQKIGKSSLLKYIVLFSNMAKEKSTDISNELAILKRMHSSDVVWDEITEISSVQPSADFVYDLTVDGTETFTTSEGIVTHNTMRSYTMASQAGRMAKVTLGLPRMVEIFDARKSFQKSMVIYLKPEHDNKQKAANFAERIKEKTVEDFVDKSSIDLLEMRIEFDMKGEIDRDLFKRNLEKLDKTAVASFRESKIFIKPEKSDIKDLRNLKNKILKIHISGIKGIEETTVVMENDRWLVQTSGTNLLEIMKLAEVDLHKTTTNDIYEIADVLGIEAARNAILRESKKTLDDQGLDVDIRHLMIVADIMTSDGVVSSVGRYGVSGQKASPLARANFEETIKHLTMASFHGERDRLNGIVENVMLGRVAPIGTGLVNLVVDPAKLKKGVKSSE